MKEKRVIGPHERTDGQILAVQNTIRGKESRGVDASGERGLLEAWGKHPGWEKAAEYIPQATG